MLTPEEVTRRTEALEQRRAMKKARRKQRWILLLVVVLLGLVLMAVSGYLSYRQGAPVVTISSSDSDSQVSSDYRRINILFMGADNKLESASRTDSLIFASIDPSSGYIGIMSIPRDTRVFIPERNRWDRINAAHAYGGAELAAKTVAGLLGVPVDYYVKTDFDGFRQIVDTLGGVTIDVSREMYYVDNAQDLHIHLQPGNQQLNGEQSLQYVRFRDRLGDVSLVDPQYQTYDGRVERQRKFVAAITREILHPRALPKLPRLVSKVWNMVETNLPLDHLLRIGLAAGRFSGEKVVTSVLPGEAGQINGAAYWLADMERVGPLVSSIIAGHPLPLRVEVLNGNGGAGMARRAAEWLQEQEQEIEILRQSNADHYNYPTTRVVVYDAKFKERVADWATRLDGEVVVEDNPQSKVDVTLIVGKNFSGIGVD